MLKAITLNDIHNNNFFKMYWFLFRNENYKKMKNDSKLIYSLLMDRTTLSIKNKWVNDNQMVYIIYTNEELQNDLNMSKPTVIKCKKELSKYGLIKETRQGLNKPNLIYLYNDDIISEYTKGVEKNLTPNTKDKIKESAPNTDSLNQQNLHISNQKNETHNIISNDEFFDKVWELGNLIPNQKDKTIFKRNKKQANTKTNINKLKKVGYEKLKECMSCYIQQIKKDRLDFPQKSFMNGGRFFASGYEDYVEEELKIKSENQPTIEDLIWGKK